MIEITHMAVGENTTAVTSPDTALTASGQDQALASAFRKILLDPEQYVSVGPNYVTLDGTWRMEVFTDEEFAAIQAVGIFMPTKETSA